MLEGRRRPDREAPFRYFNEQARGHMGAGQPVISVDTKKKELVGDYKNAGRQWRPAGEPALVKTHDFLDRQGLGKAIPYGIYDIATNTGWVSVGTNYDTATFAVASIRRWWQARRPARLSGRHPSSDHRGRLRAWKIELAALAAAAETGLGITVCRMPPGTSKWNKIEHRLFSHISMNWRDLPLTSHDVIVSSITATTTRIGLTVHAELDPGTYGTGIKVTDSDIDALPYISTVSTATGTTPPPPTSRHHQSSHDPTISGRPTSQPCTGCLRNPELTGMPESALDELFDQMDQKLDKLRE